MEHPTFKNGAKYSLYGLLNGYMQMTKVPSSTTESSPHGHLHIAAYQFIQ